MKRISWLSTILASLVVGSLGSGCGDTNGGNDDGGGHLGDGHVQMGCNIDPDCDDGSKCHTGHCNIVTHLCQFTDVQCPATDACNAGMCDPSTGTCANAAANEGGACTTATGAAGTCTVGFCQPVPSCWDPMNSFGQLTCSNGFNSADSNNNNPFNVGFGVTNAITSYGNCATGEVAPELAYKLFNSATTDEVVTIHLQRQLLSSGTGPDMATPDPDFDLIVIEGNDCTSAAKCANPARMGGGFQGITPGTSDETVTFTAKASTQYYVVVDGKGSGDFKIEVQACGKCQPTPATTLSCNMSMSLSSNTSTGTGNLGTYTCTNPSGTGTTMFAGAGKEQVFYYESAAPVVQKVKATVTGASADLTLAAVPLGATNECNPTACVAGAASTGTSPNKTASITFNAAVNDTFSPNRYFVVVDPQASGSDTAFGLQFTCFPYCAQDSATLDCSVSPKVTSASGNNGSGQGHSVSAWGPSGGPACGNLTNLSGSEYVYLFHKGSTVSTQLTFTMAAVTPNKHLGLVILNAGTMAGPVCDPTGMCASTAPVTVVADPANGILASTGGYTADGPSSSTVMPSDAKTAVIKLNVTGSDQYFWVVVDGVNGDASDFAISISGC